MSDSDKAWAVAKVIRAISNGRVNQSYAIARMLAHYGR